MYIIIPYRDRSLHLSILLKSFFIVLKDKNIKIIIVEQNNNEPFNRGSLINAGYLYCSTSLVENDLLCIHDVDQIPLKVDYFLNKPNHINFLNPIIAGKDKIDFSGVWTIQHHLFKQVNGFSNEYIGWGFEDIDFYKRLALFNVNKNLQYNEFCSLPHEPSGIVNGIPTNYAYENFKRSKSKIYDIISSGDGLDSLKIKSMKSNKINEFTYHLFVDL